ncbi:uncharacterized protein LOC130763074 isoform X2 [Actinidia eriantha]|uniref:uncharacterized protein LOC130763074 isoform X2 n=1 Tax=Actinidia eriantha TaxID=165200 RepID=UPI002583FA00|nr:uncharacterized protein LOC130763074 isoform X2 [Actinidia eriantha]
MDLKFKGAAWVGNIYQRFEAICQEVDDFVCRDTVKYVESQVQTVGLSVKKICTDIVPSSLVESGKHEAQEVSPKQSDTIGTYVSSTIGIEEKPVFIDSNQAFVKHYAIDPLSNHEQCVYPPSLNHVNEAESDLSLGPEVDALKDMKFDVVLEENDTNEELVDKKPDIVEENDANGTLLGNKCYKSDIDVKENDTKDEASQLEELELIYTENNDFSEASLLSKSIDEKNGILAEVSLATLECPTQIDKIACISFSDEVVCVSEISITLPPPEMNLSVVSSENKTAEVGLISSTSSLFTESMSEFSHENATQHEENICYNPGDIIGYVSDLSDSLSSSQLLPILSSDNKVGDTGLSFSSSSVLSLESKDVDTSTSHGATSLAGSCGNRHQCCYECTQLEFLIPSLEIGEADDCRVDITDPSMETIELSEKVKLDDSCVVVDNKLLHAVSFRAQRHRSYKKIIKDAFASKKRIRKEYEQLAILYGDIDMESSHQPGKSLLLPSLSLDLKKSSSEDLCDADWELL